MLFGKKRLTTTQALALGFFIIILTGALLLTLPIASRDGNITSFMDALFTSTSATCVTGLIIADTYTKWSLFGQLIILLEIQIGGLGFMTIGVGFAMILRQRIGIWMRGTLQESVNIDQIGGVVRLAKRVIKGTIIIEGLGALLLSLRFMMDFPWYKAIYYGIFHSISAFCNAGFDLMGEIEQYGSFVPYKTDILINIVIMLLIIIGGIGFLVWDDIYTNKLFYKRYRLQTKIVLMVTFILIFGGAILFYIMERDGVAYQDMTIGQKIMAAFFNSVTARTAGFNTTDTNLLKPCSKLLTMFLMFIGGSPGSTAGGIKTTSIAVIILSVVSTLHGSNMNIFKRRIEDSVVKKATVVLSLNLTLVIIAMLIITAIQSVPTLSTGFELVSAISTVGMSTGITRSFGIIPRILLILLMYFGRVGSMTFALSFMKKTKPTSTKYPMEKVNVG